MAVYVVNHKVENFDAWKKVYDEFQPVVVKAGIKDHFVLQSTDDKNHVTVIGEGSLDAVRAFLSSNDLKAAMGDAGVVGKPDIFIGENKR